MRRHTECRAIIAEYSKLAQALILLGLDCQIQASEDQAASNVSVTSPDLTIRLEHIETFE
jgi:hypothetical protein